MSVGGAVGVGVGDGMVFPPSSSPVNGASGSTVVRSVLEPPITTFISGSTSSIRDKIVAELEERDIGLQLVNITIQDAEPPTEAVLEAFKAVPPWFHKTFSAW